MKRGQIKGFLAAFAFLLLTAVPAFAKITIQPDFEGTAVVTDPSGEIKLFEPGDEIPEIVSGSTIEVFDGHITINTEAGDNVTLSCLDHDGVLSGEGSVSLTSSETSGLVKVVKGSLKMTAPDGKQTELLEGQEYSIKAEEAEAPATAAGEPIGTAVEGTPEPDSRSIESSPS